MYENTISKKYRAIISSWFIKLNCETQLIFLASSNNISLTE